jgi:hypothetical protein
MGLHLGTMPQARMERVFPGPKWSIFNKHYLLQEREDCVLQSRNQPIFAIPFCDERPLQQKGDWYFIGYLSSLDRGIPEN